MTRPSFDHLLSRAADEVIDLAGRLRALAPAMQQVSPSSALTAGEIAGMIGVVHAEEGVGTIRRLRVHPAHTRRGIGSRLLETAIKFCREHGCLKVQLDTVVDFQAALALFDRFGFRHSLTRQVEGKESNYFYLDLYTTDRPGGVVKPHAGRRTIHLAR